VGLPGTKPVADRSQVRRTNKPTQGAEWLEVPDVPFAGGPDLPARGEESATSRERPLGTPALAWPETTVRWWDAVRTMPHAATWTPADWQTAFAAAEAHARFVEGWKGCASGAELRQREKQLGMTRDARRDLRILYVPPKPKGDADLPANVAVLDDFRDL